MDTRFSVAGVAGWGTTTALIVGLLNALSPKSASQSTAAPAADAVRSQQSTRSVSAAQKDTHVVVTGRQLLNRFYGGTAARPEGDATEQYKLGVLYITVPDPIDSHLDWAYDAQLNATRRALERDGYVIDRFWMPWRSNRDTTSANGQLEAETIRSHPGVMLFRKSNPGDRRIRLIYVVGEIPTAGIHKLALIRALSEGDSLLHGGGRFVRDTTAGTDVRIVGPAFSGSAPSLRRAIDQWRTLAVRHDRPVRIITGSASNNENFKFLVGNGITFNSTVYDDSSLALFEELLLKGRMVILPNQTAMLRETSTQYGQLSRDSLSDRRIQIPFPMHISELREEYARNPDQLIIGHDMPGYQRNVRLPLKLGEGARLADGPPVVSDLTPPAVDAMLDDIARSLNAHHIKAVGILATDARDVIFLGTEVRKRVHDVLLFTYGSNILYSRPDVSQWLRGMLVVSTYPVAVESQFWDITQVGRQRVSFSGDMAEGMYNAVLMQLGDSASWFMTDYSPPLVEADTTRAKQIPAEKSAAEKTPARMILPRPTRPEIWITTVGTSSMLPVTILRPKSDTSADKRGEQSTNASALDSAATRADSLVEAQEGPARKSNLGVLILLAGIGFTWLLRDQFDWRTSARAKRDDGARLMRPADVSLHVAAMRESVATGAWQSEWLSKNRIAQTSSLLFQHEMYTILRVVSLTLALTATLILLVRVLGHAAGSPLEAAIGAGLFLVTGLFVVIQSLSFIATIGIVSRRPVASYYVPRGWPDRRSWVMWIVEALGRSATFVIGAVGLIAIGLLAHDVTMGLSKVDTRLFFFRSTAITEGVSPGIPLLIGGALFYAWCIWNCKRVALLLKSTAFEQLFFDATESSGPVSGGTPGTSPEQESARSHESGVDREPVNTPVNVTSIVRRNPAVAATSQGGGTAVVDVPVTVAHAHDPRHLTPHPASVLLEEPRVRHAPDLNERRKDASVLEDGGGLGEHVRRVRVRLSLSVPGFDGLVVFLAMAFMTFWGWSQFTLTLDALVLPASTLVGARDLTNFDLLLRICTLGTIGATLFGAFRLVGTWVALREALRDLGEMSLLYAFDGLPLPVARLTRLGLGHLPSDPVIAGALRREWMAVGRFQPGPTFGDTPAAVTALAPVLRASERHTRAVGSQPVLSRCASLLDRTVKSRLSKLFAALEAAWIAWPAALEAVAADVWDAKESVDNPTLRRETRPGTGAVNADDPASIQRVQERWLLVAGQCAAVYVVEYIEWVIHHLRNLAAFLLTAIILVNVLLASYPFQPQSALKAVFLGVTVVTVGGLVYVLLQMNRNDVLSLITKTDPGRLTWSGPFAFNLALYILVPLAALLSTEFPFMREFLFAWVNPLLRALGKG